MKNVRCFTFLAISALSLFNSPENLRAGTGIFESYGIFSSVNQAGNGLLNQYYDMQANTANPDFNGTNFGTFDLLNSGHLLQIKGGEVKTFKNGGGNVLSAAINYRVYETSVGPGLIGFTSLNLPFSENLLTAGDQKWALTSSSANLLTALNGFKTYTVEVYLSASTNEGDRFSNAGGANYKATFSTVPEPSSASLLTFALTGLLALRRRRNA